MSADSPLKTAIVAGTAYFGIVFAIGFLLGTLRTLLLAPRVGPLLAVAVELPIMITASWFACRACLRRYAVAAAAGDRLAMSGIALALLLVAELGLSVTLGGLSVAQHLALYGLPEHQLGLAGQLLFAVLPLAQRQP
jgi:hypothetical protein